MIISFFLGALVMYGLCWLRMKRLTKALAQAIQQRKNLLIAAQGASEVLGKITTVLQSQVERRHAKVAEDRLKNVLIGFDSPSIN